MIAAPLSSPTKTTPRAKQALLDVISFIPLPSLVTAACTLMHCTETVCTPAVCTSAQPASPRLQTLAQFERSLEEIELCRGRGGGGDGDSMETVSFHDIIVCSGCKT